MPDNMKPTAWPRISMAVVILASLVTSACAFGEAGSSDQLSGHDSGGGATPIGDENDENVGIDPQVLADVAAGAFPMPGVTQTRTIRIRHNARSIANEACGGPPFPEADSTANRFNQSRYASLELIAEKGLVEEQPPGVSASKVDIDDCVDEVLPSYQDWNNLMEPWGDATRTATQSDAVTATESDTFECLEREARVDGDLERADPTATFLTKVADPHLAQVDSEEAYQTELRRLSDVYVECTRAYFEAMEKELAPAKAELVERNRELLERFASEMSAAGYVP